MFGSNAPKRCVIIGACNSPEINISAYIRATDYIICADGGYDIASKFGINPHICIGDLDSTKESKNISYSTKLIKFPKEKDSTDLMLCAKKAIELNFKEVLILAATGKRMDHSLANLSTLLYLNKHRVHAYIVDKLNKIQVMTKGSIYFHNKIGSCISVLPFSARSCYVGYEGFKYGGKFLKLYSFSSQGISNSIVSKQAKINILKGPAIIIESYSVSDL